MLQRLRFATAEIEAVTALVRMHLRPIQYDPATFGDAAVRRLMRDAGELRGRLLDVARADTVASAFPDTAGIDELEQRMARLDVAGLGGARQFESPLDGDEIMALAGGRRGGPWVGVVKRALSDAVVEGEVPPGDGEAARRWLTGRPELLAAD
jgi:poly(A) polymerase